MSTKQAFAPFANALTGLAGHIVATSRRRRTEQVMSGLPSMRHAGCSSAAP